MMRSASVIAKSAWVTVYPEAVPVNRTVSWSSVTVSAKGVTVTSADPLVSPEAIVTVTEAAEAS